MIIFKFIFFGKKAKQIKIHIIFSQNFQKNIVAFAGVLWYNYNRIFIFFKKKGIIFLWIFTKNRW